MKEMRSVLKTGKSRGGEREAVLREKAGWFDVFMCPVKDYKGKITSVIMSFSDITEKKNMEEHLKESEEKFRAIFENAVDGIMIADPGTRRFFDANRSMCRMLGYKIGEIKRIGVEDIHPKESIGHVVRQFNRQSRGEITLAEKIPVKRKDGSVFYADVEADAITHRKKKYLVGIFRDITERMNIEDAIEASEAKYRTLYDSSRDAIMIASPKKGFLNGNKTTLKMFGCRNEKEFVSLSPAELSPKYQPDGRLSTEKAQEMMGKALKKGMHFFEWTHKRTDGTEFFATVLLTKAKIGGKYVVHATVRDISKKKKDENELREKTALLKDANSELKRKIEELEAALSHIKTLEGYVPICANCKKMRREDADPKNMDSWVPIERYISERTDASFTHGLCPDCVRKMYGQMRGKAQEDGSGI